MKIKIERFNREKNYHIIQVPEGENSSRNKADFFVGCGIKLAENSTPDEYDNACLEIVGKIYELDKDSWSEQHQMYLPNDYHLKELTNPL